MILSLILYFQQMREKRNLCYKVMSDYICIWIFLLFDVIKEYVRIAPYERSISMGWVLLFDLLKPMTSLG